MFIAIVILTVICLFLIGLCIQKDVKIRKTYYYFEQIINEILKQESEVENNGTRG